MTRVHVFCEGQTEDVFVREVLEPHFERMNIWLNRIIIHTSSQGRGGVTSYKNIRRQIEIKCKEDPNAWVTTLLDFYGLPSSFPGMPPRGDSLTGAKAVENAFKKDIDQYKFIANIVVHEFESLLFSKPAAFDEWFYDVPAVVEKLTKHRNSFDTPEHINNGKTTAPSKRIQTVCKAYDKVLHGSLIALDIGLDTIRQECRRFDAWVERLEKLGGGITHESA